MGTVLNMEQQIREYEKYIAREVKREMDAMERKRIMEVHAAMLENFQHERKIHLRVTLFFAFFAMEFLLVTMWTIAQYGWLVLLVPLYLTTLILVVLTGFYIKHYYFLENHIQGLYKYIEEIGRGSNGEVYG